MRKPAQSSRKQATRLSFNAASASDADDDEEDDDARSGSPSRPSTPSNNSFSVTYNTSLMRTPIAAKTPTRSSVRFKSKDDEEHASDSDEKHADKEKGKAAEPSSTSIFRTPSRKGATSHLSTNFATPRGLFSPASWAMSPFRTPSRRYAHDPADPRLQLDDELAALATAAERKGLQDSPGGFFGHAKGLLYESPSLPSPSTHWRPW